MKILKKYLSLLALIVFIPVSYALEPIDDDDQLSGISGQDGVALVIDELEVEGDFGWGDADNDGTLNFDEISISASAGSFEDPITIDVEPLGNGVSDGIVIRTPKVSGINAKVGRISVDGGSSMGGLGMTNLSAAPSKINIKGSGL